MENKNIDEVFELTSDPFSGYQMGYINALAYALDLLQGAFPYTAEDAAYAIKARMDARLKELSESKT